MRRRPAPSHLVTKVGQKQAFFLWRDAPRARISESSTQNNWRGASVRNLVLRLSLLLSLAVSFRGQTDEWKVYRNTDGNFRALFPGEPKDTVNPAPDPIHSNTLLAIHNGAVYMVVYAAMPTEQPVNDASFEVYKSSVFQELPKCNVGKEGPAAPSIPGYIGHWYRLNCEQVNIIGNLYWGKHYAYAVMAIFPVNTSEPSDSKRFVNSFAVIES
jgi:hypothetical protein